MANFTLRRVDLFPSGTTVEARKRSVFGNVDPAQGTAPPGAAEKTAVSDGTQIAFTGLADSTEYVFSGQVGGVWKHTNTRTAASSAVENGQLGIVFPTCIGYRRDTSAAVASRSYFVRGVPPSSMLVGRIGFSVSAWTLGDTADPPVDVALYDSTGAKLGASGATTGKLNATGPKTAALATPVQVLAGQVYYAAIAIGVLGTSTLQLICAVWDAQASQMFGATVGVIDGMTQNASPTTPANMSGAGAGAAAHASAILLP